MPEKTIVPASEFARNFGRYREHALTGDIVRVSSHGRVVGGYLSAKELEHFERLKRREREVLVVGELPDDVVEDITAAEYDAEPA